MTLVQLLQLSITFIYILFIDNMYCLFKYHEKSTYIYACRAVAFQSNPWIKCKTSRTRPSLLIITAKARKNKSIHLTWEIYHVYHINQ